MAKKSMPLAIILSIIITGLGLAYAGKWKKWIAYIVTLFVINVIGYVVAGSSAFAHPHLGLNAVTVVLVIDLLIWLYALYDTYATTKAVNA